jgi:AbrB family looped-hinge helix DNA binding protein
LRELAGWRSRPVPDIFAESRSIGGPVGVSTKISAKFQIFLPKEVRERQGWKPGQELVFVPKGDGVLLVSSTDFDSLQGIAKGANTEGYRDRDDRY